MRKGIRASFAGIFVCLYILSFLANSVFYHTHYLPDGEVVRHSHPYNTPKHSHSESDFHFLPLGQLAVIAPMAVVLVLIFRFLGRFVSPYTEFCTEDAPTGILQRGPPSFV